MRTINRAVLLLKSREPFLHWAASLDDEAPTHADMLSHRVSVYLVPEDPKEEQETPALENFFEDIFERELENWCPDESLWPARRDFTAFQAWFDVVGESIVLDLGTGPIRHDPV